MELEDENGEIRYYADCVAETQSVPAKKAPAAKKPAAKSGAVKAAAKPVAKTAAKSVAKPAAKPAAKTGKASPKAKASTPADMDVRVAGTAAKPARKGKKPVQVGDAGPFGRTL